MFARCTTGLVCFERFLRSREKLLRFGTLPLSMLSESIADRGGEKEAALCLPCHTPPAVRTRVRNKRGVTRNLDRGAL